MRCGVNGIFVSDDGVLANSQKQFLTPTSLLESDNREAHSGRKGLPGRPQGRVIGTLAHRILEAWDFTSDFGQIHGIMERILQSGLVQDFAQHAGDLQRELLDIFEVYSIRRSLTKNSRVPRLSVAKFPSSFHGIARSLLIRI